MKGILYKDLVTSRKTLGLYLLVFLMFAVGAGESSLMISMLYSIMLPINVIAFEERSRVERMLVMMPVRSLESVLAKYLISYGFMALAVLMNIGFGVVRQEGLVVPEMLLFGIALGLLIQAVTLPLIFWLGVEKGRAVYLIAIVALTAVLGGLSSMMDNKSVIPSHLIKICAAAAALMVNIASIFISAKVYEKRLTA